MEELFSQLKCSRNKVFVKDCPVVLSDKDDNRRLYLTSSEPGHGFRCVLVTFVSSSTAKGSHWNDPYLKVDVQIEFDAYGDEVRHMHVNSNDSDPDLRGYIYYPGMEFLAEVFKTIADLEKEFCNV